MYTFSRCCFYTTVSFYVIINSCASHFGPLGATRMEKWKGKDVTCRQVWCPILGTRALHLTHPSAHTHSCEKWTQRNKHTLWTPPGAVGSQCYGTRGAIGGLVEGLTSVGKRAGHSLHNLQSLPYLRLEPANFWLTSLTLTIMPRLLPPPKKTNLNNKIK